MRNDDSLGEALLTLDLDAVAANWRFLRDRVAPAECSAVVKANAYGLGAVEVAARLAAEGCRTFFVALPAEGIALRRVRPDKAIYILDGLPPGAAARFSEHGLRPVLGSLDELSEWRALCGDRGLQPAALHIETGMNRLGLSMPEALALDETDLRAAGIDLVMSHFISAELSADPVNAQQQRSFATACARFPTIRASLANSSGIFLGSSAHRDLVRPGFALYGGNPTPGAKNPMRGTVRLDAPILQLRTVEDGESVGYNGRWRARGRRTIAVIGVGYADGFLRSGSGEDDRRGGFAVVAGHRCPFAGRVSMDLITLDVTGVPGLKRGDPAQLIGPDISVDEVGRSLGTSGYEVLTGLSRRYARRYLGVCR